MIAVIRSEWLKLRTTAVPVGPGRHRRCHHRPVSSWSSSSTGRRGRGRRPLRDGLHRCPTPPSSSATWSGPGFRGYLFALLLGTLIVTTEFRHKTVTTSFLVTPRRAAFVAGKLITAAVLGAVLAVILLVATVIGGGITLSAQGGSFSDMVHQIPAVAPGMILVFALFAILGVGVGSVLTNQVAAIIVCLGWFLIVEQIIVQPGPRHRAVGAHRCRHRRRQPDPGTG